MILNLGAVKAPAQRSQANREARSQTEDRNRAQDTNRYSQAVPETGRVWWAPTPAIKGSFQEEGNLGLFGKKGEQEQRELNWVRNRT